MKNQQNNICVCGHLKDNHINVHESDVLFCNICCLRNFDYMLVDHCKFNNYHKYVPDNLRFLEEKYTETFKI